jgi:hypothetical protein
MNDTACDLQPDPNDAGRQIPVHRNTAAVTVRELFPQRPCPEVLELALPARPMLTSMVVLTHRPESLP